jgi:Fe-S-cluster containining protein
MIRCLSFHAAYRCRHTGACCRAGWTIPFDETEAARVHTLSLSEGLIVHLPGGGKIAAKSHSGACVFFDRDNLCAIQRAGGHDALPVSCRIFPRSVLMDPRGTFVSLSHFCPTAAALLFVEGPPAAIIDAPSSLVGVGPLDGLDAREAWPPLLRHGVLMDLASYDAWERLGVELLTRDGVAPDAALAALDRVAARIAAWAPDDGPLVNRVHDVFATAAPPTSVLGPDDVAVKRWLAARLFACWLAYQKDGLAAIVGYLHSCFRMFAEERLRGDNAREAIRRTDLRVMHT